MKKGDTVRVYPHGDDSTASEGVIVLLSTNERSIAVAFPDPPRFTLPYIGVHPELGIILLAYREVVGPWIDVATNGHFEIENVKIQ